MNSKFLIFGLGSMGKRRVRNLQALGVKEIVGFDMREDRRKEAEEKYGISTVAGLQILDANLFDAFIVSTPPDKHNACINFALERGKPVFVEASVILEGLAELDQQAHEKNILIAPSCTMRFHPAIKEITRIVRDGAYGKVTNFSYHCGQYLLDWHPWEKVTDYYVGKKETGGAREILPFELTWLIEVVGWPRAVRAFYGKTMDLGADIDDTYAVALDFGAHFGVMVIDVVARYAVRSLILNLERGQIAWRWDENVVKLYDAQSKQWSQYVFTSGSAASGYNKNITEDMYVEEMRAFLNAIAGKGMFPNTLNEDIKILKLLHAIEGKI